MIDTLVETSRNDVALERIRHTINEACDWPHLAAVGTDHYVKALPRAFRPCHTNEVTAFAVRHGIAFPTVDVVTRVTVDGRSTYAIAIREANQ